MHGDGEFDWTSAAKPLRSSETIITEVKHLQMHQVWLTQEREFITNFNSSYDGSDVLKDWVPFGIIQRSAIFGWSALFNWAGSRFAFQPHHCQPQRLGYYLEDIDIERYHSLGYCYRAYLLFNQAKRRCAFVQLCIPAPSFPTSEPLSAKPTLLYSLGKKIFVG